MHISERGFRNQRARGHSGIQSGIVLTLFAGHGLYQKIGDRGGTANPPCQGIRQLLERLASVSAVHHSQGRLWMNGSLWRSRQSHWGLMDVSRSATVVVSHIAFSRRVVGRRKSCVLREDSTSGVCYTGEPA